MRGKNMKTLTDLNNILFEQLDRLDKKDLSQEDLDKEIKRINAMTNVAVVIVNNASLLLKAQKVKDDNFRADTKLPAILEAEQNERKLRLLDYKVEKLKEK